ncbi:MAG: c-type cytochrome domain-containing protein [Pirellulales bacterium]
MHARTLLTVLVGLTFGLVGEPSRSARSQETKTPAQAAPAQAAPAPAAPAQAAPEVVTFQEHILPIFRRHCASCHNPDKATSDLNLISYPAVLAGGASGEAVSPGKPEQSLLYRVVAHLDEPAMPPKQPRLPAGELAAIKRWIELGAPDTRAGAARSAARSLEVDPTTLTAGKPEGPPPMPQQLPAVTVPHTSRAHPVTALAASPWAPLIAVSGHECILLYHAETLAPLGVLPFPERIPFVLKFSRNGKLLLAAGGRGASSGLVVLFDVASGQRVAEIGEEVDAVLAADLSPDHRWVALGGSSRLVKIYETSTGELRHRLKKHTDWVTALEFSPQGDLLASGDRNGGAYIWEATTGGVVFTLGDHRESISDLSWRADSQVLATASEDGRVILWFAEDGFPTRSINAHAPTGTPRNVSPRNRLPGVLGVKYAGNGTFGTVGRDATARLWRSDGNQLARFEGFTDVPSRVVLSHDGQRLFAGDYTGQVRVWNVADQKLIGQVSTNP